MKCTFILNIDLQMHRIHWSGTFTQQRVTFSKFLKEICLNLLVVACNVITADTS